MKVEKLKLGDFKRAAEIYNQSLEHLSRNKPIKPEKIKGFIEDKKKILFGAYKEKELVGHLILNPNEKGRFKIGIVVEKEEREKGIGTLLLEKALEEVSEKKIIAEILEDNSASQSFFKEHGFEKKGVKKKVKKERGLISLLVFAKE